MEGIFPQLQPQTILRPLIDFFLMTNWRIFSLFFAENTGKLQIHHVQVPDPFILGSSSDLFCNYSWTGGERESRPIYSIKWYKESAEFFRWVCQWHQKHKCHVQKMLTHLTTTAHCLKITQNVAFEFLNFGIFHQFLSGNTVWPQVSGFQNLAQMDHFWHF